MSDCIFCKLISGEIKTDFVYEDDECIAFNDINPKARIHLLVVPKKHIPAISEMEEGDEKIMGHLILSAKNIAEKMGVKGYKLQFNVGKDGGQEVFHIHMHLMAN